MTKQRNKIRVQQYWYQVYAVIETKFVANKPVIANTCTSP